MSGYRLNDRHHHRVSELAISLCVGDRNDKIFPTGSIETHQTRAFPRRQSSWIFALLLNQNFRAILVIPCRKCARDIVRADDTKTEAVSSSLMFGCLIFTTFSAFSLDAFTLYERGEVATALFYIAASVILSLAALAAGILLTRGVFA